MKTCLIALLFCSLFAFGCKTAEVKKTVPDNPLLAAQVVRVNAVEKYAVLRCYRMPKAGAKAEIRRDDDSLIRMIISELRDGEYRIAEILEGIPVIGDQVYIDFLPPNIVLEQ